MKPDLIQYQSMKEMITNILIVTRVVICLWILLVSIFMEFTEESVGFISWIRIISQYNNGYFLSGVGIPLWLLPRFPTFPYHNHLWIEILVFLYHDDNVDVGCKYQVVVDNTMNHVVHATANYDLVLFHWSNVFVEFVCLC